MTAVAGSALRLAAAVVVFAIASAARADGAMVYRERVLFREGPAERGYCDPEGSGSPVECDRALTKVLSGYSYARGEITGGLAIDSSGTGALRRLGVLRLSLVSAALPGGDLALGSIEGALGDAQTRRLRFTLFDAQGLFFCRDAHISTWGLPFVGMVTRGCAPSSRLAVDLGVFALQWDAPADRIAVEWVRFGPAVSLLGNGLGYARLLRSIEVGLPFDVRTLREATGGAETSLGVGLRVSAFYRTPQWEARLMARHRVAVIHAASDRSDHSVEGEVRLLHNFFLTDAVVVQAGLSLRASYSREPRAAFSIWASAEEHSSAFAGLHFGWNHESPGI